MFAAAMFLGISTFLTSLSGNFVPGWTILTVTPIAPYLG